MEVANPAGSGAVAGTRPTVPLTERILAGLPGPRLAWVVAWALVPWLNLAVIVVVDGDEWAGTGIPTGEILNRTAVSFAVLLSLFGAARITDELRGLRLDLVKVVEVHVRLQAGEIVKRGGDDDLANGPLVDQCLKLHGVTDADAEAEAAAAPFDAFAGGYPVPPMPGVSTSSTTTVRGGEA